MKPQEFRGVAITTPIKVAKLAETAILPTVHHEHDAGIDFYAYFNTYINPFQAEVINTGIAVAIPTDCVGLLWPKGSNDFLIGAGVVDWTYQGSIMFKVVNYTAEPLYISKGEAIGQMVIVKNESPSIVEVDQMDLFLRQTKRGGTGGISGTSLSE